jgi:hypothetical protein
MAQIHSKSSPLRDMDNKVPQCPSTIPRTIPSLEPDTQTFLPLIMPNSKSTPRSSRSPNSKLPFRMPNSSSRSRSPKQLENSDLNYVFGPSLETNYTEMSSGQRFSSHPRFLPTWDSYVRPEYLLFSHVNVFLDLLNIQTPHHHPGLVDHQLRYRIRWFKNGQ